MGDAFTDRSNHELDPSPSRPTHPVEGMIFDFMNFALPNKRPWTKRDSHRLEAVRWLYDCMNRETRQEGRSTFQMIAILEQAMKRPGFPIPAVDHLELSGQVNKAAIRDVFLSNLKSRFEDANQKGHPEFKKMFRVNKSKGTVTYLGTAS